MSTHTFELQRFLGCVEGSQGGLKFHNDDLESHGRFVPYYVQGEGEGLFGEWTWCVMHRQKTKGVPRYLVSNSMDSHMQP